MGLCELDDRIVARVCQSVPLGFCALTGRTLPLYHLQREACDIKFVSVEPTIPFKARTLMDIPNSISWPGMERLRTTCLGIVLIEIPPLFPEEKRLLTPREAARAEELGPRRRKLFIAARVALKKLARQIGLAHSDTPDSSIETLGPDRVRPCLAESDLYCSVSHTNRFATAVGAVHPVGVDIEVVSEKSVRIWHLFMPSKNSDLLSTSAMAPERAATLAWTIKEAAAKAFGLNLSEAIREVEIVVVGELESAITHRGKTYSVKHAEGEGHVLSLLTCGGF
jgi:phosphopantetheinyl transferase